MAKTSRRKVLFGGAATGIFVFGIVMAVLGTLFGLPEMRQRLKIDLEQQGNVFLLLYVGILLATLIAQHHYSRDTDLGQWGALDKVKDGPKIVGALDRWKAAVAESVAGA